MLKELYIKDFGIFAEERIHFQPGMTVVTGETGAGKSLVVGAIALLLGARAQKEDIRSGSEEATVEGVFESAHADHLQNVLADFGVASDGSNLVIRRVLSLSGRSRIFINDQSVTLNTLAQISRHFLDLSGQHAHQTLLEEDQHINILDEFASQNKAFCTALSLYQSAFENLHGLVAERNRLTARRAKSDEQRDFLTFRIQELKDLNLEPNEDVELKTKLDRLQHATKLFESVSKISNNLGEDDGSALERVGIALREFEFVVNLDSSAEAWRLELEQIKSVLKDAAAFATDYLDSLDFDPSERDAWESRWLALAEVRRKYGSVDEALEEYDRMVQDLASLDNVDGELEALSKQITLATEEVFAKGGKLSELRKKAAKELSTRVLAQLKDLAMKGARFAINVSKQKASDGEGVLLDSHDKLPASKNGLDRVSFEFSANAGEPLKALSKVASGGELARLMLALKLALALQGDYSYIFDEIDTGVGGLQAEVIGIKLAQLAKQGEKGTPARQVFCVTHHAPIAALGQHHMLISKEVAGKRTVARTLFIGAKAREEELARMLAGATITEKSRAHAREMLKNGQVTASA